ncbi:Mucin-like protein [Lamellibrachia satsuma]|nr:Mucin-like protein [Lamellibrachia satsuma]
MGSSYKGRTPTRFEDMFSASKKEAVAKSGFAMFAPMWTDADARQGHVFYHVYNRATEGVSADNKARTRHAMTMAAEDVRQFGGLSDVDPSWVMVITWADMLPRASFNPHYDKPNTFQLVIIYDASRWSTFVMFSYEKTGWDTAFTTRDCMIGYYVTQYGNTNSEAVGVSRKPISFRMAALEGNTGLTGRYLHRVASGKITVNYEEKCKVWYYSQNQADVFLQMITTLPCPCDRRLARYDRRWKKDRNPSYSGSSMACYYQRNLRVTRATQYCCYDEWGSLIVSEDGAAGHMFAYHPNFFKNMHKKYDLEPKTWCCSYTDNCFLYLAARPVDYCWNYVAPFIGWLFGDPHIRTLDGLEYTFNGLGEYTLIATTDKNFTLQGRTSQALGSKKKPMQATVFSAFAAQDSDSDRFHVQMNTNRDGLIIYVDEEDIMSWFYTASDGDEISRDKVTVSRKSATSVDVSFSSGFTLAIGVKAEQLDITVGAPTEFMNKTRGLMGVFNNDPYDDMLPADGGSALKSSRSTERTIFSDFGQTWRIVRADSIFKYIEGKTFDNFDRRDFEPLFLQEVLDNMQLQKVEDKCKGNNECIFDYAVTGKEEVVAATLETKAKNTKEAETLANRSPVIIVNSALNATIGEEATLTVATSDKDGDAVTLSLQSELPSGANFNSETEIFVWTPSSKEAIYIS